MILTLRCAMCDKVKQSKQDTDELVNAESDEICPACFVCDDCDSQNAMYELFHEHLNNHSGQ
jgi:hypothetical protein